jgi:hypothetical protein
MLIGLGGSGKQTLTRFATFILGFTTFSVNIVQKVSQGKVESEA